MTSIVKFFTNNYELVLNVLIFVSSIGYTIILYCKNRKRLKATKTDDEKTEIVNEIKADVMGFISIAESMFADIPKSGGSKLLYVLNEVKRVCGLLGIEYDSEYWTKFVNDIVDKTNEVLDLKELEAEKKTTIEKIKSQVPHFISRANELFANIPDSDMYKVEYVLKLIAVSCENESINVFTNFNWREYVESFYVKE